MMSAAIVITVNVIFWLILTIFPRFPKTVWNFLPQRVRDIINMAVFLMKLAVNN